MELRIPDTGGSELGREYLPPFELLFYICAGGGSKGPLVERPSFEILRTSITVVGLIFAFYFLVLF